MEENPQNIQNLGTRPSKLKKRFKWTLIGLGILTILIGIRVRLTKAGIIQNRLGVKNLCVDCKGETFISAWGEDNSRKNCCEGTYNLNRQNRRDLNGKEYFAQ